MYVDSSTTMRDSEGYDCLATWCAAAGGFAYMAAEQVKLYLDMACKGDPSSKAEIAHIAQIASHLCTQILFTVDVSGTWAYHALPICECVNMFVLLCKLHEVGLLTVHRYACLRRATLPDA